MLEKIGSVLMFRKSMVEEDEVLWPYRPEERYGEKTDARKDGRQAEKGQTSNKIKQISARPLVDTPPCAHHIAV